MSLKGSQIFTFTWRIENFSMCPQQAGEYFESPSFVADFLENTKWKLRIYPRCFVDCMNAYIIRDNGCAYAQAIEIAYSLIALSTHNGKNFEFGSEIKTFSRDDFSNCRDMLARDVIFKQESCLLPDDALTLQCHLSRHVEEQPTKGASVEKLKTDCWNCNPPPEKYECSARTRIKVSSTSFVWPIQRIGKLPCDVKLSKSVPFVVDSELSFDFALYLERDPEEGKRIRIEICKNGNDKGLFVRCHIRTVGAPKSVQFEGQDELYFKAGKKDVWTFPTFLKINDLTESYLKYTDGALYLRFDVSFSKPNDVMHIESVGETCPLDFVVERQKHCVPRSSLEKLYKDRELVDAALRVGDREFKVHKLILSAESDVFRRMFDSGMKEEQSGVVDIADLDADTVEKLLKYMYTHQLEELNPEDAIKLYSAADKYNMEDLKCRLRSDLTASLSVDTVCETLILADLHHDEDLLESAFDYVSRNNTEIFHSHNWEDVMKNHAALAASTMFRFFVRK